MHIDQLAMRSDPRGHVGFAQPPDEGLVGDEADPLREPQLHRRGRELDALDPKLERPSLCPPNAMDQAVLVQMGQCQLGAQDRCQRGLSQSGSSADYYDQGRRASHGHSTLVRLPRRFASHYRGHVRAAARSLPQPVCSISAGGEHDALLMRNNTGGAEMVTSVLEPDDRPRRNQSLRPLQPGQEPCGQFGPPDRRARRRALLNPGR